MASCISISSDDNDSSRAPENFNIASTHEEHEWSTGCAMKCPMCLYSRKSFHCRNCVRDGNFVPSSQDRKTAERFSTKKARFEIVQARHRELTDRAAVILNRRKARETMIYAIRAKQANIKMLEHELQLRQQQHQESLALREELKKHIQATRKKFPQYENNVANLCQFVERRSGENSASSIKRNQLQDQLRVRASHFIRALVELVFPISLAPCNASEQHASDLAEVSDHISELSEATRTAYVCGRWVLQESLHELHHIVVAPSLPANGDYSAYLHWVLSNKDGVPQGAVSGGGGSGAGGAGCADFMSSQNDAYRISGALTYATQVVAIFSYILDVHLPFFVHFRDFCNKEMNAESFRRRVARLNANVLALCYSQNVDPELLSATHTLANIQQLLIAASLGRGGPVAVSYAKLVDIDLITADLAGEDSDDENDENSLVDWEAISHLTINETVAAGPGPTQHSSQPVNGNQQAVSIAGGLMNNAVASVTSMWRGFTGR